MAGSGWLLIGLVGPDAGRPNLRLGLDIVGALVMGVGWYFILRGRAGNHG